MKTITKLYESLGGKYRIENNLYKPYGESLFTKYYYIVNDLGEIWHRDGKFRKKTLNDMKHYKFSTEGEAQRQIDILNK